MSNPLNGTTGVMRCERIHTNRADEFFSMRESRLTSGKRASVLFTLVEESASFHGQGMMKRLIQDLPVLRMPRS